MIVCVSSALNNSDFVLSQHVNNIQKADERLTAFNALYTQYTQLQAPVMPVTALFTLRTGQRSEVKVARSGVNECSFVALTDEMTVQRAIDRPLLVVQYLHHTLASCRVS